MSDEVTYQSAMNVWQAGRDLRDALGDAAQVDLAVEQLAIAVEQSMMQLDTIGPIGFDSGAVAPQQHEDDVQALLGKALSQLTEASTVLAASKAIGETDEADPAPLDESLREFNSVLVRFEEEQSPPVLRFAAETGSDPSTLSEAVAACDKQVVATLEAMAKRSTESITASVTGMREGGPDFLKKAWESVNSTVNLEQVGGRLARLGLRLLNAAIGLLTRIVPSKTLTRIRAELDQMIMNSVDGAVADAIVGSILGVDKVRQGATDALTRAELDTKRLNEGTAALRSLDARHQKQLELWDRISVAIGYARTAAAFVKIAIPHLALIILGAHLLVTGAVVVTGRGYVSGDTRSVSEIVDAATR